MANLSTPKHSVSVAAAIVDDHGRVLAIRRRDNSHWEPPGGVLDLNETIPEGLAREVREETGVDVEIGELTGVYKNVARGIVALVFRCRALTDPVAATAEAQDVRWLHPNEIAECMDEAYAIRLLDALRPGSPSVRAHDGIALLEGQRMSAGFGDRSA